MNKNYGWVIVAAGALMSCVAVGSMFSLAVYLTPLTEATGWSRAGVPSAMSLNFISMGIAGFLWGFASDRFGPRVVVVSGAILLGLGQVLASRAGSLVEFQLAYGIIVGLAGGAFFAPLMATVTTWFDKNRALAVSLVSAGMGVAPMTVSPFARWLISAYDWRTAMITIGIFAWCVLIPAALLVRRAPSLAAGAPVPPAQAGVVASLGPAFRSPQFIILALTFFGCCCAHSGPIFHMMSNAILCGVTPMAAVSIYSVEGLSGLGGRLLLGLLADRFGVKRVLAAGLLLQALSIASYLYVSHLGEFYVLSVVFGLAYGGVMPLYAVLAREYFGPRIMGTVFGAATLASSIGMAIGPLAGGWIFDSFGAYTWLYVGAALVALGAMAMALLFPPQPSRMRAAALPA